ncbi:MAG TPA: hypothetical protein VJB35_02235 [Candidatus Nanoarchaeia archaeon]|nr:hypothetical protein [Candidatus Nanoarchaeia archaeon]
MANDKISIDKIICDKHPDSKFKQIGIIPNSDIFKSMNDGNGTLGKSLNIYCCDSCEGRKVTLAYECFNCGIVKGVTKINEVIPSKDLGGRQTDEYFCKQCNIKLGEFHKRIF